MNVTFTFPVPYPTAVSITRLTRADTSAPVVGGSITGSGATWVLTFTEPAPNLVYNFVFAVTITGFPVGSMRGTINGAGSSTVNVPVIVQDFNVLQSETAEISWTVYDTDGNAVNLAGHVLNFVAWTSDDAGETKEFWFRYSTVTGEITIGGTSGNVVTVELQGVDLALAPNFMDYNLNDATGGLHGLAVGVLKVAPALMEVPES